MPTTRLGIDYMAGAQAGKHITFNEALDSIDAVIVRMSGSNARTGVAQTGYSSISASCMFQLQDEIASGNQVRLGFTKDTNSGSGLQGLHIEKKSTNVNPVGISLDYDTGPLWDTVALDATTDDLVLAYSHSIAADQFRFRRDTGQCALGRVVGQPASGGGQLQVMGGTTGAPTTVGVAVTTYGNKDSLQLLQGDAGTGRAKINFDDKFQFGSDAQNNDSSNWWVYHNDTSNFVMYITTADSIGINMGSGPAAPAATLHITRANAAANPAIKPYLKVVGVGDTALTASTEHPDISFELQRTVQWATGNFADQRFIKVLAPTMGFVGASTVDRATTLYIDNAPIAGTNATLTQRYAIWVDAGKVRMDGDGTHVLELPEDNTDPTSGGGAATGRIPILVNGNLRYLSYYT